jgi:Protein phosphatase 2C
MADALAGARRGARAGWVVVPATVTGPSHIRDGTSNQDRYRIGAPTSAVRVFAVADGAGSRQRSAEGAQFAVDAACRVADELFGGGAPDTLADWDRALAAHAHGCLRAFDEDVNGRVDSIRRSGTGTGSAREARTDFATTLLVVVAAAPWFGYWSVGDGFLVAYRDPGGAQLVLPPPLEREHSGQTVFLTSRQRDAQLRRGVLVDDNVVGLALCTDGLIEGLLGLDKGGYLAPPDLNAYFRRFSDPAADPGELSRQLQTPDFAASSGDDKTIVLAVRPR